MRIYHRKYAKLLCLTKEEIAFIESMVCLMEIDNE